MEKVVKYYLAQQVPFFLFNELVRMPLRAVSTSFPVVPVNDGSAPLELTDKLNAAFKKKVWSFHFRLQTSPGNSRNGRDVTEFRIVLHNGAGLKEVFGENLLQAEIFELRSTYRYSPKHLQGFRTQEMPIASSVQNGGQLTFTDSTYNAAIDDLLRVVVRHQDVEDVEISGKMNLIMIGKAPHEGKMTVYKRMLEEQIAPDTVIVSSNGKEIKCHRAILATHSVVFQAMFGTDMQEAKNRRVEMLDMDEEGVRAFLAYLYYWDESKPQEKCSVALELLKAGHKYIIGSLERAMRKLLLSKPESWFEIDVAMQMFLFVRNLDGEWESLKKKSVIVMAKNSTALKNLAAVRELFRDADAAFEFYQYSASVLLETSS